MTDLVTMQVIRYGLEQVADEMGYTLVRTGRSTIITEIRDISCVVTDAKGQTVAQAHHTPSLLAGFEITMKELVRAFPPEQLAPGDVIITNDPYTGGQHIMDLYAIAPAFHEGKLAGFVGNITHHSDLGGVAAGGVAGGIREIYLEGLRLPMVKLVKAGQEDPELFAIIANQIRVPDKTLGDIRAQISSLMVGCERLGRLYRRWGWETMATAQADLLDYSERRMRQGLKALPAGTYVGEDFIDDDGINDRPIRIETKITLAGDSVTVDMTGSDPQAEGNTNSTIANTHAAVYYTLIALVDPGAPPNSGCYRPIRVLTKLGSIVHPKPPGAVAARTNASTKIVEAMLKALAPALPDRVTSGSHGQISTCGFGGTHPETGERFIYTDIQGGGASARATKDGADGQDCHLPRFMNTPVEITERQFPVRIERYEFILDTGGAGTWRGGLALRRDIRLLADRVSFARYGDRQKVPPFGLFGGLEGAMGEFWLNPDTPQAKRLKSKGLDTLANGDLVSIRLPGAGGYGDPKKRERARVKQDLDDEKISPEAAKRDYGWEG
ncbi:MAG: hydantoinase B/oxoprolinase family protein [Rhodospirillales bacterium]|nr:hydantoinase B/oxoprolinase family protein [Rhodospirillales bacterium]